MVYIVVNKLNGRFLAVFSSKEKANKYVENNYSWDVLRVMEERIA